MQKSKISQMFSDISTRYDFMNHLLSFGLDIIWRKKLVNLAEIKYGYSILDIATGTGDVAIEFAKQVENIQVTGVDFSTSMLQIAKQKVDAIKKTKIIHFQFGDALNLPFKENTFDVVTMAFGIRNVENYKKGLKEMHRVTKKGGQVLILEFSKPNDFIAPFYWFYLQLVIPFLGAIFSKREAYYYLSSSIKRFVKTVNIATDMQSLGYVDIKQVRITLGIVSIYIGKKP